jgi:hypothetical protein
VNLHPAGYDHSSAAGISGDSQVGNGLTSAGASHALLWYGTAASVVDLHPDRAEGSFAHDVEGDVQVGSITLSVAELINHAYVWRGSAESGMDLHSLLGGLGPDFIISDALAIGDNGTIYGVAVDASARYAVAWTPIPPIDGDFDEDGDVDGVDFARWQRGESPDPLSAEDLAAWEANYGATLAQQSASAVPEPSAGRLLLSTIVAAACFILIRRLRIESA